MERPRALGLGNRWTLNSLSNCGRGGGEERGVRRGDRSAIARCRRGARVTTWARVQHAWKGGRDAARRGPARRGDRAARGRGRRNSVLLSGHPKKFFLPACEERQHWPRPERRPGRRGGAATERARSRRRGPRHRRSWRPPRARRAARRRSPCSRLLRLRSPVDLPAALHWWAGEREAGDQRKTSVVVLAGRRAVGWSSRERESGMSRTSSGCSGTRSTAARATAREAR